MTATTNVTPTEESNQPASTEQPIDNMGNPVNPDGTPAEPKAEENTEGTETLESVQKALKDTKAELTRLQQGNTEEQPVETNQETLEIQAATKEAEDAGVDMGKYSNEFAEKGSLSEDSYKELEGKGFTKEIVDSYIEGQKAITARQTQEVAEVVGGEENFRTMQAWAAENMTEAELTTYNEMVTKGTESAKMAVRALKSKYTEANGSSPNLLGGGTTSNTGDVYKSPFEMNKAMQDERYWNDPDFQKEVKAKVERSVKAGTV